MAVEVYCARLKDNNELMQSSSGGVFTALSNSFIDNGDFVLCSIYDYKDQELRFEIFNSRDVRDKARGSKYFASHIGTAFRDAIDLLKKHPDKKLLFVGLGCQAEGFRKLAETAKVREQVYVIDIICTGNPSQKVWKSYISNFQDISLITFKDKRNGWYNPTSLVVSNDREVDIQSWLKIFYGHNADKPSCAVCPFARVERNVDITIGDFWRIEKSDPDFFDPNGNSVILIHSQKGRELFESAKEDLLFHKSDLAACWQSRLYSAPGKPVTRRAFWHGYNNYGIDYVIKKYSEMPMWGKFLIKMRNGVNKVKKLWS